MATGFPIILGGNRYWTPAKVPTALWLDAADSNSIRLNGSTVRQWNDKSGNGNTAVQTIATSQPSYSASGFNSKPGITFDGLDDYLLLGTGLNLSSQHFVVMAARYISGVSRLLCKWIPPSGLSFLLSPNTTNANRYIVGNAATAKGGLYSQIAGFVTTPALYGGMLNSQTLSAYLNGTVGATTATSVAAPDVTSSEVTMGNISSTGIDWSNYSVGEVIICDGPGATPELRQLVEGYLAWKWGGF